mmetsp:Transcript_55995/g.103586  ORF Transcript_55995/g.103586 Transcript_55995/m.103586 type:complete len:409 (-) Transcript_55995:77-1303(-)
MEIRLESINGSVPPEDTFVAVRIGDVQKQSRFESARTYKFSGQGEQWSHGRIEVFKRVGCLTVNLEDAAREVKVPCESPGFPENLAMNLAVVGSGQADLVSNKAATKTAIDAAQRYIDANQIEDILAEAMREVLKHRPEDPNRFLSNHFLQRSDVGPIKPKPGGMVPNVPRQRPTSGGKRLPPLEGAPALPKSEVGSGLVSASPKPSAQNKVPDFRCCPSSYWARLHSSFVPKQPSRAEASQAEAAEPSIPPQPILETRSSSKFVHMPSVGGMLSLRSQSKELAVEVQQATTFAKKPSVGTWLASPAPVTGDITSLRLKMRDGLLEASMKGSLKEVLLGLPAAPKVFYAKPSVGTWLVAKPKKMARPWYFENEVSDQTRFIADLQRIIHTREDEVARLRTELEALKRT